VASEGMAQSIQALQLEMSGSNFQIGLCISDDLGCISKFS
jgi:hypothetical protein